MITYNDIYEALRKEKYSDLLQELPKTFIRDVAEYLRDKKEFGDKKEDMFSDEVTKIRKQLENAVAIFRELMLRRKKKLLSLAFVARETGVAKRDFDNMTDFEREMFEKIVKSMEDSDRRMNDSMNGASSKTSNYLLVSLKENIEEFMGLNGEPIGPFLQGEMANLPEEIAKILVDSGKADILDN